MTAMNTVEHARVNALVYQFAQTYLEKRGWFDDLARWWNEGVADFNAKLKEQQAKMDDFNKKSAEAAKDAATVTQQTMKSAADAIVKSATSKVIEVHAPCAIAGNGAADCASAAANACKGKGFSDGQPLDVRTAEKCNASLWLQGQGQRTANAECPVETVVLRAACQLRTPLHGSPLAPRSFCISQEKVSASVLNSQ